ncbi:sensor histidine kinase [Alicyclobacillus shizuokensis]|uniref:sensor histidine kinase n=1 Tax=Alicyclobacillus shizuokensis TaxID=392014 RepID=UPI001FE0F5F5|nr:HAMP domain-containing sensor histidine kinase [Alicyclobacillus shizuokensis]
MTVQLRQYNNHETEKKIDLSFYENSIESLAIEINRQLSLVAEAMAEKRRTENELRQAVANISHDLRTPLTSVFGYIQLLESDGLTPQEQTECVVVIKRQIKRLQALLNDFFELSVVESTDYSLNLEQVNISRLLPEILIQFYDQFTERSLSPIIQIPNVDIFVIGDSSAIRRVVENLILNAIRHAEGGEVSIDLERSSSTTRLVIANSAKHLTDRDVELLFNRFYMADKTRSGQGSGLGLSIAKSLMLKMNGNLTARLIDSRLYIYCEWIQR